MDLEFRVTDRVENRIMGRVYVNYRVRVNLWFSVYSLVYCIFDLGFQANGLGLGFGIGLG